jgi:hypothetical protein
MLQPGIAFLEEGLGLNRKQSVTFLGLLTALGSLFVVYFSNELKALDTLDFWVGTFLIYLLATILIIVFGWVMGIEPGWREAHRGAALRIPSIFKFIIKYVSPLYLLAIFGFWIRFNVFATNPNTGKLEPAGYVKDLVGQGASTTARLSVGLILIFLVFFCLLTAAAGHRWDHSKGEENKS